MKQVVPIHSCKRTSEYFAYHQSKHQAQGAVHQRSNYLDEKCAANSASDAVQFLNTIAALGKKRAYLF